MKLKNINIHSIHKLSILGLMLLLFAGAGCKKFVRVEPPKSQLLGELVFHESGTAQAAMAAIYGQLRSGTNGIFVGSLSGVPAYLTQYADEMENYSVSSQTYGPNFYKNILYADSEDILSVWNVSYNQIYNVNALIEGLAISPIDATTKNQLTGEALFVRGALHFYLTNLFGSIPYIKSTDYIANQNVGKKPVKEIYKEVLVDLQNAVDKLSQNYPSAGRVRVNKSAAMALMARVYLYDENWLKAAELSTNVIDQPLYKPEQNLSKLFLKESTSTIWAFQPNTVGNNTLEAFNFLLFGPPAPSKLSFTSTFLESFEPDDLRATSWISTFSNATGSWKFPYKYKINPTAQTIDYEYSVVLRIEEQFLIRAEANAHLGKFDEARKDLNVIRLRSGLSPASANNLDDLLKMVLQERRAELFVEFGHRFFDLKRMGKLDAVLGATKPNWDTNDRLWPIPEKEIMVNRNLLPQNPGYN